MPPIITNDKRHQEILEAALHVFAQNGFAATDVQAIADRVGVGKGTIYRQFESKENLFLATARHAQQCLVQHLNAATAQAASPLARLRIGMHAFIGFFDEHPQVVELLIQERANFPGRTQPTFFGDCEEDCEEWNEMFRELIRTGIMRDLPLEQIEDAISKFVFGVMFVNYFAGRQKPLAQQCDEIFDVLFNGLLVQPPQP